MRMERSARRRRFWASIWASKVPPIKPAPTMKRFTVRMPARKNASCTTLSALALSFSRVTIEMFSSDDPCAVATTLIPFLPRAEKTRPEIPARSFICSPTTAMTQRPASTEGSSILPAARSGANSERSAAKPASASPGSTAQQIESSLEACVIRITLSRRRARALNILAAMPVTPGIPMPCMLMRLIAGMEAMPRTGKALAEACDAMRVPGAAGSFQQRRRIGMPEAMAGRKAAGLSDFAPKWVISSASL